MRPSAGFVDHAVNDIEIAPAALFIVRATSHQAVVRLRNTLFGKVVLQQLHHR
ncbi:hypothetical protein D3C71_1058900 [compost metagenome]